MFKGIENRILYFVTGLTFGIVLAVYVLPAKQVTGLFYDPINSSQVGP
jgi:hypothetical protein